MKLFTTKIFSGIFGIILLCFFLLAGGKASAQLIIDNTQTPTQLVQNVLIGSGVTVSNITFTGDSTVAICAFSNGDGTNLGLDEGIILSTGIAGDAANPGSTQASTNNGEPGDPDLDDIPGVLGTNDAATIEFDFIPQSDTLTFRYVFGSEEYPEFVGQYNDVFAFFITGPNPAGGNYANENIALIPGTTLPVSINNVNAGSYPEYYIDNQAGLTIVYDGFTTVLEAVAIVTPCSTYHMKLTIADDVDGIYDSGVFLEANSFSATGLVISSNFSSSSPSYGSLIEGCNEASIYFELVDPIPDPYVIHFSYSGTAINGVDYLLLPDSIVIPPGGLVDSLNIIPVQNFTVDPTRTLTIAFDYLSACSNENDTMELLVLDNTIWMNGLDTFYCSSDPPVILDVYPPTGVLTGPGTSGGNTFNPLFANPGQNIIRYNNYFIDYTINPPDTVCVAEVADTVFVQFQATCDAGTDDTVCQGQPYDFSTAMIPFNEI